MENAKDYFLTDCPRAGSVALGGRSVFGWEAPPAKGVTKVK
jgi:hypothetical protein